LNNYLSHISKQKNPLTDTSIYGQSPQFPNEVVESTGQPLNSLSLAARADSPNYDLHGRGYTPRSGERRFLLGPEGRYYPFSKQSPVSGIAPSGGIVGGQLIPYSGLSPSLYDKLQVGLKFFPQGSTFSHRKNPKTGEEIVIYSPGVEGVHGNISPGVKFVIPEKGENILPVMGLWPFKNDILNVTSGAQGRGRGINAQDLADISPSPQSWGDISNSILGFLGLY
jgi:hypothetical protein